VGVEAPRPPPRTATVSDGDVAVEKGGDGVAHSFNCSLAFVGYVLLTHLVFIYFLTIILVFILHSFSFISVS